MNGLPASWWVMAAFWFAGLAGDMVFTWRGSTEIALVFRRLCRVAFVALTVTDFAQRQRLAGACGVACIAFWFWTWWRKNRQRVKAMLGAKSRALRDALVKRAREAGTPRPVLRPVPVPS